ncbi:hypothetical protein LR48_Vigan09g256700 [Vigna angularis]|uniref:Transposase-associated domain-containing protein n=1 Tax=Phaseolus angularis TaxID=3914 RepID=A0A0L9VFW7_PHAAN|nr:uncharacterized protein LOC108343580 [Vigna angularis]KAG2396187.1 uncharacterized protein HKW66_Vig0064370 [Vigna angularis]KOM53908.1 hypothetical protein LR48_Vigan09g256700 [Vigna angularis]
MAEVPNHRAWMYDRCYSGRRGLKEAFVEGVEQFLQTARQYKYYVPDGGIRCPCMKCECTRILKDEVVRVHLYQKGFMPNYTVWTFNGEEIPHTYDRPFIEPYGRGFVPSRVASAAISWSIKDQFLQPWPSWGAIPAEDREPFWQRFKQDVQWIAEHEAQIKKNFQSKASQRLSKIFRDARITGRRPYWMGEHIWNSLLAHWTSPDYRNKCAQRNRALEKGGVLHTRGSISTHEHAIHMATELGQAVHVDEVFTQTHLQKGTSAYVDERSRKTIEDFSLRFSQAKSEVRSISDAASRVDAGDGNIRQPSTSDTSDESNVVSRQAYDALLARLKNLENLVMTFLPQQGQNQCVPSSSQQQHPPMQPTPMQPSANQQPPPQQLPLQEDDDDSDDYNDY